jgi:hypothetical protein
LERWKREEKLSGSLGKVTQKGEAEVVSTSKAVDQRPPERALSPLREILEISARPPESSKEFRAIWEGQIYSDHRPLVVYNSPSRSTMSF